MNGIQEAQCHGRSIWLDYLCRSLLKSGEFQSSQSPGRTVMQIHFSRYDGVDDLELVRELN